jgi:hypothetical protein
MMWEEKWLLALADSERLAADLPIVRLDVQQVAGVCALANLHGVLPAVLGHLENLCRREPARVLANPSSLPEIESTLAQMHETSARRTAITLFLQATAGHLVAEFTAAGVEVLLLKGADFATRLYARPALRPFIDVDLLVRSSDWAPVEATLGRLGYSPRETKLKRAAGHSERSWEHPNMAEAMVEVHDNLVHSPTLQHGFSLCLDDLPVARAADRSLQATPAGLLVMAAVHGAASHSFN